MGASCSRFMHCKNPNGEYVRSRLFDDLLHYAPNRDLAKEYYYIGTHPEFLSEVSNKAEFDENGQITLNSLIELAKLDINETSLLLTLNKDIKEGNYEYQEAIEKLQAFNRSSQFKNNFMATIELNKNGTYYLKVVKKSQSEENALAKEISNRSLQEQIIFYLTKNGVNVDFLNENQGFYGRYSTLNAERTHNGLYALISVLNGENMELDLAEEAGHFIIASLGNNPLVERLFSLLTPELQKEILGEEYFKKDLGNNPIREVAGYLVGKSLLNANNNKGAVRRLIDRIINKAKQVYSKITKNEVLNLKIEAENIANSLAGDFLSFNFQGTVETALQTQETLYHKDEEESSQEVKAYNDVLKSLKETMETLRGVNDELADKIEYSITMMSMKNPSKLGIYGNAIAVDRIYGAIRHIANLLEEEIPQLFNDSRINALMENKRTMYERALNLVSARTLLEEVITISDILTKYHNIAGQASRFSTGEVSVEVEGIEEIITPDIMSSVMDKISEAANTQLNRLYQAEVDYMTNFLLEGYGKEFIQRSRRVLFNKDKDKKGLLKVTEGEKIPLQDLVQMVEREPNFIEKHLKMASFCPDYMLQIVDKIVKDGIKKADDLTIQDAIKLRKLEYELKYELGIQDYDMNKFCEILDTGEISGNYLTDLRWGDFERDRDNFRKEMQKQFLEEIDSNPEKKANFEFYTNEQKEIEWQIWYAPKLNEWYRGIPGNASKPAHGYKTKNGWVPNKRMYTNSEYFKLTEKELQWYAKFRDFQKEIYTRLGGAHIPHHRMPQFEGSFTNIVRNRLLTDNSKSRVFIKTAREWLLNKFSQTANDQDFGSMETLNNNDLEIWASKPVLEFEKINRVQLFGINKLQDKSRISTDLFASLMAFSSMTNTYVAMNSVSQALKVGEAVAKKRTIKGSTSVPAIESYEVYKKYLKSKVYGITMESPSFYMKDGKRKFLLAKVLNTIESIAVLTTLAGNIPGGLTNSGTAMIEMFKEAYAGSNYNTKDFIKANALYLKYIMPMIFEYGSCFKSNKLDLFLQRMNALDDNSRDFRNYSSRSDARLVNMWNGLAMLPYSSGEHWMQSIPYLAMANKIKLHKVENGKIVETKSLFDIYGTEDLETDSGKKMKEGLIFKTAMKKLIQEGIYLKDDSNLNDYNEYVRISEILPSAIAHNPLMPLNSLLSKEDIEFLQKKGFDTSTLNSIEQTYALIEEKIYNMLWTADDESKYKSEARLIANNMHGVYNKIDKVAFQHNVFGNFLLGMRGYGLGLGNKAFQQNDFNVLQDKDVEGVLNTKLKVTISKLTSLYQGDILNTLMSMLPYGDHGEKYLRDLGFSDYQIENNSRFNVSMLVLAFLSSLFLVGKSGVDDDEDDLLMGYLYYFSLRLLYEQAAYTPLGFYEEYRSITSSIPIGMSTLSSLAKIPIYMMGDLFGAEWAYYKRDSGIIKKGTPKWHVMVEKKIPYWKGKYFFPQPAQAAKSYQFNKEK